MHKITVKTERLRVQPFDEKIGILLCQTNVLSSNSS